MESIKQYIDDNFEKLYTFFQRVDKDMGYTETRSVKHRSRVFSGIFTGYNESDSGAIVKWIRIPFSKNVSKWDA